MKEIFEAIYSHFTANVVGSTDLYNTVAPADAVFPYTVMRLVSGIFGGTLTEETEELLIQFNIYDDDPSSESVCDIWQSISDTFNEKEEDMSIDNYEVISITRYGEASILNRWEEEGKQVWDYIVQFRFIVCKK